MPAVFTPPSIIDVKMLYQTCLRMIRQRHLTHADYKLQHQTGLIQVIFSTLLVADCGYKTFSNYSTFIINIPCLAALHNYAQKKVHQGCICFLSRHNVVYESKG